MKNESKKAPVPRKSASLYIFRPNEQQKDTDYEFLLLQRKGGMSFGNMMTAPGGVLEQQDFSLLKNLKKGQIPSSPLEEERFLAYRITALRESFEETGVFFVDSSAFGAGIEERKQDVLQIVSSILKKIPNTTVEKLFEGLVETFGLPLSHLLPLGRIISLQTLPKRFDTTFFGIFLNNPDIFCLNVAGALENFSLETLFDLNKLKINLSESENFTWRSSSQCLEDYYQEKIDLAPPQILQFHHFQGFPQLSLIQRFYREDLKGNNASSNELVKRPFYYPCIFVIEPAEKSFFWVLPGDDKYPLEKVAENEESEELKAELSEKSKTLIWDKPQMFQLHLAFDQNKRMRVRNAAFLKSFVSTVDGISNALKILKSNL